MINQQHQIVLQCQLHHMPLISLCLNSGCSSNRLSCRICQQNNHKNHKYASIKNKFQSQTFNQHHQKIQVKTFEIQKKIKKSFACIGQLLINTQNKLNSKILSPLTYIVSLSKNQLENQLASVVKMPNSQKQLQNIATLINEFQGQKYLNSEHIQSIFNIVLSGVNEAVKVWRQKIQNAYTQLLCKMQNLQLKNWHKIKTNPVQVFNEKGKKQQGMKRSAQKNNQQKEQYFLAKKQINDINQVLSQIFQKRPLFKVPIQKNDQKYQHKQQVKVQQKSQDFIKIFPSFNAVLNQVNQKYKRFVLQKNTNKKISKNQIIYMLSNLKIDRNYVTNLRQLIIENQNQFDLECLKKVVSCFPNLTKLNFTWNFEEQGLRLQQEQVFFQKFRTLQKDINDLPMSQELLNTYGGLYFLQNLSLNQIQLFANNELKIINENIKHLTFGAYVQSWQSQELPSNLQKFANSCHGLITLNIFNIKKINGIFLGKLIIQNFKTFRNLWLSQCVQFEDIQFFLKAIKNSQTQSIIFDQVKNIKQTISIPSSLKTLIVQNCWFYNQITFQNLTCAFQLVNFSIFDCTFQTDQNVGDRVIEEISSMKNHCKIQYINVGECRSVTNHSLKNLQKIPKLKHLCIDNTRISLNSLSKSVIILNKIIKLGIVGLQAKLELTQQQKKHQNSPMLIVLQQLLKKSPKLQLISLKFFEQLINIDETLFQNLRHFSISAIKHKKQYRSKILKQFVQKLEKNNINFKLN